MGPGNPPFRRQALTAMPRALSPSDRAPLLVLCAETGKIAKSIPRREGTDRDTDGGLGLRFRQLLHRTFLRSQPLEAEILSWNRLREDSD